MKLVEAQEGRRILDRLFGYEMSLVTRRRAGGASSAGRVQSVAARLVVERERERMAFRVAAYWDLQGAFVADTTTDGAVGGTFSAGLRTLDGLRLASGKDFEATTGLLAEGADVALLDEDGAATLAAKLEGAPFRVESVETKAFTERPKPPFTTSTLQQEAGRKLNFSAARAMSIAQKLYENGHITYMRTDSTNLSEQAITAAPAPDQHALRRRVPPGGGAHLPRQGEERPGGARGDPPRRRHDARPRGARARAAHERRAPPLRADLEAHDRLPDVRRSRAPRHGEAGCDREQRRGRRLQRDGSHDRVPRVPARVRRGCRRPRRRARGPRGDPPAARRGRRGRVS